MKRDQAYEIAVSNFQREHERWIQNAVVLFGVLISILLTYKKSGLLARPVVLVIATVISAMAVFVSLIIRGSTDAWRDTVRHIEECRAEEDIRPFLIFKENLDKYTGNSGHWRDFIEIVWIWRLGWKDWKRRVLFSVTRLYTLMAFAAALLFALLLAHDYLMPLTRPLYLRAFVRNGTSQPTPTPEKHETPAAPKADHSSRQNQQTLQATIIEALHAVTDQEKAAAEQTRAESRSWISALGVQKGLLIVGVIYSIFAWKQWSATRQQAVLTREALAVNKRAFIYAEGFVQLWEPGSATGLYNWRFRPRWRNAGETSTQNMTMYVDCEIREAILPSQYDFPVREEAAVIKGFIGPKADIFGGVAPRGAGRAITPQDILDVQEGRKFIYLWGWLKYYDLFPGTPEHISHFCWLIGITGNSRIFVPNTPGQPPSPHTLAFQNLLHQEGNYAD